MKKLIFTLCCLLATVVFCTHSFAGNKMTNNNDPSACYVYNFEDSESEMNSLPAVPTMTCTYCCLDNTNKTAVCSNGFATVVLGKTCAELSCGAGDCPDSWSWSPTTYLNNPNIQKPTFSKCGPSSGSITYTVTAWNSTSSCCAQISKTLTVNWPVCNCSGRFGYFPSDEEKDNKNIKVFPNPSSGNVTVQLEKGFNDALLQVYDMQGALVTELIVNEQTMQVDLSKNPKGTYFIQVVKGKEGLLNKKVIIE